MNLPFEELSGERKVMILIIMKNFTPINRVVNVNTVSNLDLPPRAILIISMSNYLSQRREASG
jgi:hypothetical protein